MWCNLLALRFIFAIVSNTLAGVQSVVLSSANIPVRVSCHRSAFCCSVTLLSFLVRWVGNRVSLSASRWFLRSVRELCGLLFLYLSDLSFRETYNL